MSVAPVAQNKTKISFFLCANFLLFCRLTSYPHRGFALDPLVGLKDPPDTKLYTRALRALLSVHLNKRSNKKTLFRPL